MTKSARLAALLLGLIFGALALAQSGPGPSAAFATEISGSVMIQAGNGAPRLLRVGQPIPSGATLLTGADTNAVLKFADGQVVVLGERTTFRIADYRFEPSNIGQSRDVLNLVTGSARLVMGAIGQSDPALVHLHVGNGTIFPVATQDGGKVAAAGITLEGSATLVTVTQGQAFLSPSNGNGFLLASGGGIYMQPGGNYQLGGADQISTQLGESSYGTQIAGWLYAMQGYEYSQRSPRTVITLAAPGPAPFDLPPPSGSAPITAVTGAGGGGKPCSASCN